MIAKQSKKTHKHHTENKQEISHHRAGEKNERRELFSRQLGLFCSHSYDFLPRIYGIYGASSTSILVRPNAAEKSSEDDVRLDSETVRGAATCYHWIFVCRTSDCDIILPQPQIIRRA